MIFYWAEAPTTRHHRWESPDVSCLTVWLTDCRWPGLYPGGPGASRGVASLPAPRLTPGTPQVGLALLPAGQSVCEGPGLLWAHGPGNSDLLRHHNTTWSWGCQTARNFPLPAPGPRHRGHPQPQGLPQGPHSPRPPPATGVRQGETSVQSQAETEDISRGQTGRLVLQCWYCSVGISVLVL